MRPFPEKFQTAFGPVTPEIPDSQVETLTSVSCHERANHSLFLGTLRAAAVSVTASFVAVGHRSRHPTLTGEQRLVAGVGLAAAGCKRARQPRSFIGADEP